MLSQSVRSVIEKVARDNGMTPRNLVTVVQVESAGEPTWKVGGRNVPPARPEAHKFYERLSGAQLDKAVALGLAHPKAGVIKVPRSREAVYEIIGKMEAINKTAARESCSWGVGQVMGFQWKKLGYSSVNQLVDSCYTLEGSVDCMARYIKAFALIVALNRGNDSASSWKGFTTGYNGPAGVKWGYHTKCARAWEQLGGSTAVAKSAKAGDAAEQQRNLKKLGYYTGPIDGVWGNGSKAATKRFQREHGLLPDGVYGAMTRAAVEEALSKGSSATAGKFVGGGAATAAATGVGQQIVDSANFLPQGISDALDWVITGLIIVGVGLLLFGLYKKFTSGKLVAEDDS